MPRAHCAACGTEVPVGTDGFCHVGHRVDVASATPAPVTTDPGEPEPFTFGAPTELVYEYADPPADLDALARVAAEAAVPDAMPHPMSITPDDDLDAILGNGPDPHDTGSVLDELEALTEPLDLAAGPAANVTPGPALLPPPPAPVLPPPPAPVATQPPAPVAAPPPAPAGPNDDYEAFGDDLEGILDNTGVSPPAVEPLPEMQPPPPATSASDDAPGPVEDPFGQGTPPGDPAQEALVGGVAEVDDRSTAPALDPTNFSARGGGAAKKRKGLFGR